MSSTMLSACGKIVNSLGAARRKSVDVYPQNAGSTMNHVQSTVYNYHLLPVFPARFPHFYPQVVLVKIPPLNILFSPLSTVPITTTTNLKKEER